ncbi:MAG: Dam family site-specific DNA-(adenine-N6)-methyltransferase [Capsulimonadaceae bacterium]|nr:Dam family site-specific DNA-(adenine-N6)-methyltransferase [Capsulimonadaceae bacterium]
MPPIVPPIKCQGIKTKLVNDIKATVQFPIQGKWIEPFCGSCVVVLNVQPQRALLADCNVHIISLYRDIQSGAVTGQMAKAYLSEQGELLRSVGEAHYYAIRDRFNREGSSLDFLFLNRSCFNGVMRFNKKGHFNVPFCRKPDRFAHALVTKITNQITNLALVMRDKDWQFEVANFRDALSRAEPGDVVYADPPYAGRHVDYYNSWSDGDELDLTERLKNLPCQFILSTWIKNVYRENPLIEAHWRSSDYEILSINHFYHVGSSEDLRHSMEEGIITNARIRERHQTAMGPIEQLNLLPT